MVPFAVSTYGQQPTTPPLHVCLRWFPRLLSWPRALFCNAASWVLLSGLHAANCVSTFRGVQPKWRSHMHSTYGQQPTTPPLHVCLRWLPRLLSWPRALFCNAASWVLLSGLHAANLVSTFRGVQPKWRSHMHSTSGQLSITPPLRVRLKWFPRLLSWPRALFCNVAPWVLLSRLHAANLVSTFRGVQPESRSHMHHTIITCSSSPFQVKGAVAFIT